ncbi:hypothetical protein AVEN_85366-1 [Araneus ventricosus]|uniref:Uncharacterized protein n=1 Tax=Araneus ventricosus TaxID=182803 RepID=A0A4Y2DXF5_ARAVE|nr:hypothetical protein AVEN_85366-1 [Araneus ventricosus]
MKTLRQAANQRTRLFSLSRIEVKVGYMPPGASIPSLPTEFFFCLNAIGQYGLPPFAWGGVRVNVQLKGPLDYMCHWKRRHFVGRRKSTLAIGKLILCCYYTYTCH